MLSRKIFAVLLLTLAFGACKKNRHEDDTKEKTFNLTGFGNVYTTEKINLIIQKGTHYSIKAKGASVNVDKLDLKLTDNNQTLDISYKNGATAAVVEVVVTLPDLETAYAGGQVTATVKGFQNQVGTVGLILSGNAKLTAHDGATIFGVDVTGNAQLFLNGNTASLAGEVSGNGMVNAYGLTATRVYISTMQQAKAYVKPSHIFFGSAADNSRIYYKGDPQEKELETSGNGQIIKE